MDIVNLNILDNTAFKLENGTYDLDKSVEYGGRMAGNGSVAADCILLYRPILL